MIIESYEQNLVFGAPECSTTRFRSESVLHLPEHCDSGAELQHANCESFLDKERLADGTQSRRSYCPYHQSTMLKLKYKPFSARGTTRTSSTRVALPSPESRCPYEHQRTTIFKIDAAGLEVARISSRKWRMYSVSRSKFVH